MDIINVIPAASLNTAGSNSNELGVPARNETNPKTLIGLPVSAGVHIQGLHSMLGAQHFGQSEDDPVTLLRSLSSILSIIGGRLSPYVGLLQKKIAETPLPFTPSILEITSPQFRSPLISGSPGRLQDAELLRDFWEDSRSSNKVVWNDTAAAHASIHAAKEVVAADYLNASNGRYHSTNPQHAQAPYAYPPRPFQRSSGHWPIGTEILGTISEVGYLDGWRGGTQLQGENSRASSFGGMR